MIWSDRLSTVLQEFFQLLMRDMFDPNYGMFKLDEETRMYWFRASKIDMSMEFELVGTMIGLAIYNSHLLEFSFPMLTYRSVVLLLYRPFMMGIFVPYAYTQTGPLLLLSVQVNLLPLASHYSAGSFCSLRLNTGIQVSPLPLSSEYMYA